LPPPFLVHSIATFPCAPCTSRQVSAALVGYDLSSQLGEARAAAVLAAGESLARAVDAARSAEPTVFASVEETSELTNADLEALTQALSGGFAK